MKIFTNKNLIQKLIIAIVIVTLLNFCIAPVKVEAKDKNIITSPILGLITTIGDALIQITQWGVTGNWITATDLGNDAITENSDFWGKNTKYSIIQLSPELIFADEIELLNVDFIGASERETDKEYIIPLKDKSGLSELRKAVASWYATLRIIAIVGLLSVLIYVGIRIIISSTAQDKAKYKQRLVDWLVAFCILFFMHYIMAGIVIVVNKIDTALISGAEICSGIEIDTQKYGTVKYPGVKTYYSGYTNDVFTDVGDAIIGEKPQFFNDPDKTRSLLIKIQESLKETKNASDEKYKILWENEAEITKEKVQAFLEQQHVFSDGHQTYAFTFYRQREDRNSKISYCDIILSQSDENPYTKDWTLSIKSQNDLLDKDEKEKVRQIVLNVIKNNTINGNNSESGINTEGSNKIGDAISSISSSGQPILVADGAHDIGNKILYFINYARLFVNAKDAGVSFSYLILYWVLIIFTLMFTIRYIKRVIYIAFLTLISPLVALTYPLDKIKDRKSTGI